MCLLPTLFLSVPIYPTDTFQCPEGVGVLSDVLVTAYGGGTRDRVAQPCVWLLSVVLQCIGALLHRETADTSLFPELGRLLHSEEFPRACDEAPSAQLLAGAPGLHVAT